MGKRLRIAALLAVAGILVGTAPDALRSAAAPGDQTMLTVTGMPVDGAIAAIWQTTDGPVAGGTRARAWMWGPAALAASAEFSADSPAGVRRMVYFDKGRLDILEGAESPDSDWYITGALLVTQMLSGEMRYSGDTPVRRPAPAIAVAGDLDQPNPLTYASLAPLASIDGWPLSDDGARGAVPEAKVGQPVAALISADGTVTEDVAPGGRIIVGAYDPVTGHNIAAPFADWAESQPVDALWLTGRPLTEPYWLDTLIGGESKRILVQAFERRILTYAADQPRGWNVESNNAGAHYRLWRGLYQPDAAGLLALASYERFGEEIVGAAVERGVDPFLLAAIAQAASASNPMSAQTTGGVGLLAVRPEVASELGGGDLFDPRLNTLLGATELSRWSTSDETADTRSVLAGYFTGGRSDIDVTTLIDATLGAYDTLLATYQTGDGEAPPVATDPNRPIASGAAAYYSPSYDRAWWEKTMRRYAQYGLVAANWQVDPNGYYCVRPGYIPGQLLHLVANGVEITCTIGDTVAAGDVASWRQHWAIEMNWEAFLALDLDRNNEVVVFHLGPVG